VRPPSKDGVIRVMIVDDHPLVRAAVAQAISAPDVEMVAEAASAEEALLSAPTVRPDVLLVDIHLSGMTGVQLVRELAPRLPDTRIVMLTVSAADRDVADAIGYGAVGYLTKDLMPDALLRSVRAAYVGDLAMPRGLAARLIRRLAGRPQREVVAVGDPASEHLSPRERDVLRLIEAELTDRQIAELLGISPRTVATHVSSILHKLGVRNRAEAARRYREET
jgi:two-component system, NarL family, response regulator DevR